MNNKKKVGLIGSGHMGYGMAKNLLNNFEVYIIAHKNRKPIDKLKQIGAIEVDTYSDLCALNLDCLFLCVTNTPIALSIANEITDKLHSITLVIDITTHHQTGSIEMLNIFLKNNINYCECPVMGGPVQSEEGILGGILGTSESNFKIADQYLKPFCKNIFHFGDVGQGAKAKLICNFLSLGTTTFVIETIKALKKHNVDLEKFYEVAKLGSGNSGALSRVADKAIYGDYKGYIFSVDNTHKDLTYIHDLLKDMPNAEKLSSLTKSFYKNASDKGMGDLLISELIEKDND